MTLQPDRSDPWDGAAVHAAVVETFRETNLATPDDCSRQQIRAAHRLLDLLDDAFGDIIGPGEGPLIHPAAEVHPTSVLGTGVVVGPGCRIGPHCYLRSNVLLTREVTLGFGVELDRAVLHDGAKITHTSCTGRSAVGAGANLAFGFVTATRRLDRRPVRVPLSATPAAGDSGYYVSTASHHGAVIGADVVCGVNVSLMPGATVMPGLALGPNASFRGVVTATGVGAATGVVAAP